MKDYERVVFPETEPRPAFTKIVEATEKATELPNGVVISERKIRQWQ